MSNFKVQDDSKDEDKDDNIKADVAYNGDIIIISGEYKNDGDYDNNDMLNAKTSLFVTVTKPRTKHGTPSRNQVVHIDDDEGDEPVILITYSYQICNKQLKAKPGKIPQPATPGITKMIV